jgi:hypothetical protein
MVKFLKLTHRIINVKYINQIYSFDNSYTIIINTNNLTGLNLFGFGTIDWFDEKFHIKKDSKNESDIKDYQIVKDWIEKLND